MDTVLLVTTIVSLALALLSALAVRRMKHRDQERVDARVAALAAAAAGDQETTTPGNWIQAAGEWQWDRSANPSSNPSLGPSLREETPRAEPFFGTVQREQQSSGRFALIAAAALVVAVGGAFAVFITSGPQNTGAIAVKAAHSEPLDLVSLGHSRDAGTLTITGIVRNPMTGPTLEGLTAVVSLIGNDGALISTKDVPLDYRALGPGEEAPFRVSVPDPGSVARYRVSFRTGTDVVAHVDRRNEPKLAGAL